MEEGIEDMQSLLTASLVDLMLGTRAPVARLADWIDQATLYIYMPKVESDSDRFSARTKLRALGIRTATDLERAWKALGSDRDFVARASNAFGVSGAEGPAVIKAVVRSFRGEVNLWHVREFKRHEWLLRDHYQVGARDDRKPAEEAKTVVDIAREELRGPRQISG